MNDPWYRDGEGAALRYFVETSGTIKPSRQCPGSGTSAINGYHLLIPCTVPKCDGITTETIHVRNHNGQCGGGSHSCIHRIAPTPQHGGTCFRGPMMARNHNTFFRHHDRAVRGCHNGLTTHSLSENVIRVRRDHLVAVVSYEQSLAEHCPANVGQFQIRNEMENHIGFKDGRVALFDALKAALAPIG